MVCPFAELAGAGLFGAHSRTAHLRGMHSPGALPPQLRPPERRNRFLHTPPATFGCDTGLPCKKWKPRARRCSAPAHHRRRRSTARRTVPYMSTRHLAQRFASASRSRTNQTPGDRLTDTHPPREPPFETRRHPGPHCLRLDSSMHSSPLLRCSISSAHLRGPALSAARWIASPSAPAVSAAATGSQFRAHSRQSHARRAHAAAMASCALRGRRGSPRCSSVEIDSALDRAQKATRRGTGSERLCEPVHLSGTRWIGRRAHSCSARKRRTAFALARSAPAMLRADRSFARARDQVVRTSHESVSKSTRQLSASAVSLPRVR